MVKRISTVVVEISFTSKNIRLKNQKLNKMCLYNNKQLINN